MVGSGQVYFIGTSAGVKIGVSCSARLRMGELLSGCPLPMVLLGFERFEDRKAAETRKRELYKRFQHLRMHHDWFLCDEELASVIGVPLGEILGDSREILDTAVEIVNKNKEESDKRIERIRNGAIRDLDAARDMIGRMRDELIRCGSMHIPC